MTDPYGFSWGVVKVTRIARYAPRKGQLVSILGIKTPRHDLEIYVSRTGFTRVFRNGVELTPDRDG